MKCVLDPMDMYKFYSNGFNATVMLVATYLDGVCLRLKSKSTTTYCKQTVIESRIREILALKVLAHNAAHDQRAL